MKKIHLTQGKCALVDDIDFPYLNRYKWYSAKSHGVPKYAARKNGILMHRVIMNPATGYQVDHKDGNTFDNRRENLRICSTKQNAQNRKKPKNNTLGYKGIFYVSRLKSKPWGAHIQYREQGKKKRIWLGQFATKREAANAYDSAARDLFGQFALTNKK